MIMELAGYALNMTTWEEVEGMTTESAINGTLAVILTSTSRDEILEVRRVPLLKQTASVTVLLSMAYSVVFLLAVVNNSLVVTVIYRNPQMRNVTNYFLANLAIADITVSLVVLPITLLSNIFTEWHFGPFFCKAIPYLQAVAVSASVNTLVAVAMERYFAIFHPQKAFITPNRAVVIIAVIWLIPMCMQVPWALFYNQVEYRSPTAEGMAIICYPRFPSQNFERLFFLGAVFLACYLVPLFFISVCYSLIGIKVWKRSVKGIRGTKAERNIQRSKIRIVRMLVVVALFFTFSWLALYSIRMRILYGSRLVGAEKKIVQNILFPLAQWFGAANSCVNPFVYCYFSEQFRKGFAALLSNNDSCCRKFKFESLRLTSPVSAKEDQQKI